MATKPEIKPGDFKMPWGKHAGEKLRDIPMSYLDWLLGLADLNKTIRKNVEGYLATQAEYDREPADWREGREDYDPNDD